MQKTTSGFKIPSEIEHGNDSGEIGDPMFVNPVEGDFRLQPGSPAIDQGSPVDAPDCDFDGNLRPQDGDKNGTAGYDIGAFEMPY